ncbi:hypothetical protein Tco_0754985 [Tanacetum coccineum]
MKLEDVYLRNWQKVKYVKSFFSLFLLALAASEVFGADEDAGSVVAWSPLVIISHITDEVGGIGRKGHLLRDKPNPKCWGIDELLGWLLEEIHMTWIQLEKKRQDHDSTTTILKKISQTVEMASQTIRDGVMSLKRWRHGFLDGVRNVDDLRNS